MARKQLRIKTKPISQNLNNMTDHDKELIKKLEQDVNNLRTLLAGTQAGESTAWEELNHTLTELKIAAVK